VSCDSGGGRADSVELGDGVTGVDCGCPKRAPMNATTPTTVSRAATPVAIRAARRLVEAAPTPMWFGLLRSCVLRGRCRTGGRELGRVVGAVQDGGAFA
jgi:hypothetical protein